MDDGKVLISVRNPARMSVPAPLQWRTAEDVRGLIAALQGVYGPVVHLVCHDYQDLEFAAGFPEAPRIYFEDVERYVAALRACKLSVTYRLHAFLPCLAFGVHSLHLSYDERGRAMMETIGMGDWDINLMHQTDLVDAVLAKAHARPAYEAARHASRETIQRLKAATMDGIGRFASAISRHRTARQVGRN